MSPEVLLTLRIFQSVLSEEVDLKNVSIALLIADCANQARLLLNHNPTLDTLEIINNECWRHLCDKGLPSSLHLNGTVILFMTRCSDWRHLQSAGASATQLATALHQSPESAGHRLDFDLFPALERGRATPRY